MKYIGQFTSLDNKKYSIEITSSGSGEAAITFSGTPCIIEWTGEEENIFKPIKYSSATFEYISDQLYLDLYAAKPLQNVVSLKDDTGKVVWQGYVTPNVYDNTFDFALTIKSIECIDGLAILEYVDYSTIGGGAKKVVNVYDIIKHCLGKTNLTYNYLYISDNVKVDNTQWDYVSFTAPDEAYLNICYISECNFYDEDGVPMKCKEVLEEICKYFNLTMYVDGQNVYMIDYCAIRNGIDSYYRYDLSDDSGTSVTISRSHTIGNTTELVDTSNISIGNTYNKVGVEADIYPFDKMIPDMFDDVEQVGSLYYDWLTDKNGYMFYMFLQNPNYRSYYYNKNNYTRVTPSTIDYNTIQNYFGATLVKHSFQQYSDPGIINSVNWSDYLLIHLHQSGSASYGNKPIFETSVTDLDERILANFNNYLVIDGTATYYDIEGYTAKVEHSKKDDDYADSKVFIPCSLCYGGKKWYSDKATSTEIMGSTVWLAGWVDYETTFELPFYSATDRDHYLGKDFDVRNNINWSDGLESSKGRKILLDGGMQLANLKFTMYAPVSPNEDYRLEYIFIKDFSIKVETSKNTLDSSGFTYADELNNQNTADSNVIYENVIDEEYLEEMGNIKNKITTFAKEQVANSTVAFSINGTTSSLFYAKTVQVESLGNKTMKEEEYTVNRLVEQYSTPSIILDVNLWDDLPMYTLVSNSIIDTKKKFIINSKTIDLRQDIATYKLIEKK